MKVLVRFGLVVALVAATAPATAAEKIIAMGSWPAELRRICQGL